MIGSRDTQPLAARSGRAADRPSQPVQSHRVEDFDDVLFLHELAAVLKTSTRTIRRHLRAGTLPIRTLPSIDKRHRFGRADVERYLASGPHDRRHMTR